jgi:NADH-quinone oxidoreductase subunit C
MSERIEKLFSRIDMRLAGRVQRARSSTGELTLEVGVADLLDVARTLRDDPEFKFEMLMDVCGVDYLHYGHSEWKTFDSTATGFSRGVNPDEHGPAGNTGRRFAVAYHLLSIAHNVRLRLRVFCPDDTQPVVDSVTGLWASADWFEREAFDLYGILFEGHADLRRILTDYGFIGHPMRKDFPVSGHVEMRYDAEKKRVIYQPVTIEPREIVPRVVREEKYGGA